MHSRQFLSQADLFFAMKRIADRQIQREDGDDPHAVSENAEEIPGGQPVPPPQHRPIRGLPKRRLGGQATQPPPVAPTPPPAPSSSPFANVSLQSKPLFGDVNLSNSAQPPSSSSTTSAEAPAPSLFSGVNLTQQPAPASHPRALSAYPTATATAVSDTSKPGPSEQFYTAIRGLNWSLAQSVVDMFNNSDGFDDMLSALEVTKNTYQRHRDGIIGQHLGRQPTVNSDTIQSSAKASQHNNALGERATGITDNTRKDTLTTFIPTAPKETTQVGHMESPHNEGGVNGLGHEKPLESELTSDLGRAQGPDDKDKARGKDENHAVAHEPNGKREKEGESDTNDNVRDSNEKPNSGVGKEPKQAGIGKDNVGSSGAAAQAPTMPKFGNVSFSFAGQSADKIMSKSSPASDPINVPKFEIPAGGFSFTDAKAPSDSKSKDSAPKENDGSAVKTPSRHVAPDTPISFGSAPGKSPVSNAPNETSPHRFSFGTGGPAVGAPFAHTAGVQAGGFKFGAPISFDSPAPPKKDGEDS